MMSRNSIRYASQDLAMIFLGFGMSRKRMVVGSGNILLMDEKQRRESDARPACDARASHGAKGEECGMEAKCLSI